MQEEHLFRIEAGKAFATTPITLAEAGLKEREDLQEWIIEHPEILGEDVLIVTFEFDRWLTNAGQSQADRLDVLGIDSSGHLLVVELKRDKAPDTVEMQALKYAAMASRFTPETLASQHARFLTRRGKVTSDSEALELLAAHVSELSIENLREPRLMLIARDFPPTVTATCVWLAERGLDITLLRFQAYRSEDQVLLTTSQLYPVPDVEEFMISPRQAEVKQSGEVKQKTQDVGAVRRLVDNSVIQDGTELTLVLGPGVNTEMRDTIDAWLGEQQDKRKSTWKNDVAKPLIWAFDGQAYSPSGLARHIIEAATGVDRSVQGTLWWVDSDGHTLVDLAKTTLSGKGAKYYGFWARFLGRVHSEHPTWTTAQMPQTSSWISMPSAIPGTTMGVSFAANGRLRSELYIDTGSQDTSKALFDSLFEKKAAIESSFGEQLSWERLDDKRASRVAAYADGTVESSEEWDAYIDWFFDTQQRLRSALHLNGSAT